MMELEEFRVDVCVHGQHIYKDILVGEILVCEREQPNNFQDRYAVAVKKKNLPNFRIRRPRKFLTVQTTVNLLNK